MTSSISFNPMATTNAAGSFAISLEGYIAGTTFDDPSARNWLAGGVLAASETLPMWGGVGISESMSTAGAGTALNSLGNSITRASSVATLTGFSVFNQNHAAINTPQSPVPAAVSGGLVNFARLGSHTRLAVPCSPSLVSLQGGLVSQQVSWDFVNQILVPYTPGYSANTITNAVWASTSGGQITFTVSTNPTTLVFAGDNIAVTGVVNTGGASTTAFNGTWVVVSTSATTIVVTAPASATLGTYASGGSVTAAAGGSITQPDTTGALSIEVLDVNVGGSMVPVYNAATGFITWNRAGSAAVILI